MEAVNKLGYKTQIDHHGPDQEGWGSPDISIHQGRRGSTSARFLYPGDEAAEPARDHRRAGDQGRSAERPRRRAALPPGRAGPPPRGRRARSSSRAAPTTRPQLLLLSGIGPADELRELGIDVVHDLPGVGRNLQDHPSIAMVWNADREVTLTNELRFDRLTRSVLEWALTGKGRIANMPVTANGFIKTRPELERPDAQCLFQPT